MHFSTFVNSVWEILIICVRELLVGKELALLCPSIKLLLPILCRGTRSEIRCYNIGGIWFRLARDILLVILDLILDLFMGHILMTPITK